MAENSDTVEEDVKEEVEEEAETFEKEGGIVYDPYLNLRALVDELNKYLNEVYCFLNVFSTIGK